MSRSLSQDLIWAGGRLHQGSATVDAADRGLLLGDGLFETLLVVNRSPVLRDEHVERLLASAAALRFSLPAGFLDDLDTALDATLAALPQTVASLRITLTRGVGPRGLEPPPDGIPTLLLQAALFDPSAVVTAGAAILDAPRIDPLDPLAGHKSTSALRWVLARMRAQARGADVALLRTVAGDMAEADFANLFLVAGDKVVTPPLSRGVLPGVTRAWAIDALRADARLLIERPCEADELLGAAEVFLTSSLIGVRPLRSIDGRSLPARAPVAAWLQSQYARLAGLE